MFKFLTSYIHLGAQFCGLKVPLALRELDSDAFLEQLDAVQKEGPSYLGKRLKYYFGTGQEVLSTVHAA